jgi:NADH dehydrogenase [ubiquinone] 1 alpha subcomplex assembly factor 3
LLIYYLLPDLLILGLGASVLQISPETKRHINSLGIRVEIQDTRNAAAQFNLLATERGVTDVAAAMIPIGWRADGRTGDLRK